MGEKAYAKGGETRSDMVLDHQKGLVSSMVLETERIEYLQLRHRGNDHLQSLECLIACADLVKKKESANTRDRRRLGVDALFENEGVVGTMASFFSKRVDQIAAESNEHKGLSLERPSDPTGLLHELYVRLWSW